MSRPRCVVVATGSELVRGGRQDRNGPFVAREALRLGLEPAQISIVGDRPDELERALEEALTADLCVVSGGLGPTHDDRTVEVLAGVLGRELIVDDALVAEIGAVSRGVAERLGRPVGEFEPGVRKQATLPEGAISLGLAGTAPGIVIEEEGRVVVALPGPPAELQRLWPRALESAPVRRLLSLARAPEHRVLRFYGASESTVARALESAGGEGNGVDATICAHDFEVHVDLFAEGDAAARVEAVSRTLAGELAPYLFTTAEQTVEELILILCRSRGLTLGAAESCTGGLVSARLTSIAGSSDVFLGGVVAYADDVKRGALGVPHEVLERHGAVSPETAVAMARGARERLGVDLAVSVTGVAGPGGGTIEKPVGLVHLHVAGPDGDGGASATLNLRSDREVVRRRATTAALHLVRTLLTRSVHNSG